MFGLEAISHNNGWTIAITGACIVFTGLATLSLVISQLHKVVALLDRPARALVETPAEKVAPIRAVPDNPTDISVALKIYQPLIEELDPDFELSELYTLAKKYHLPHPHLSIRCLRESGKLVSVEEGYFRLEQ